MQQNISKKFTFRLQSDEAVFFVSKSNIVYVGNDASCRWLPLWSMLATWQLWPW